MKRYRVLNLDFDSRSFLLTMEIQPDWEPTVRELHESNRQAVTQGLIKEFGAWQADAKIRNFADLGQAPFSIVAFHNKFLRQIRQAFVVGSYYPALTATCALAERILNHLIRKLREDFTATPEYKRARKGSFDNWEDALRILECWESILPEAAKQFRGLWSLRWRAVHFDPATDRNDRPLALKAIGMLNAAIQSQFGAVSSAPWFIPISETPGESYIRKDWERVPFVRRIYIPNCRLVGPSHLLENEADEWHVIDGVYADEEISDREFCELRRSFLAKQGADPE